MSNNGSELTVGKEIRFAVVMYGGVSLAIYINGIAQELLKMCRATPKSKPDYKLESTEKIYRKIAYLIDDKQLFEKVVKLLEEDKIAEADKELEKKLEENGLSKTRFVVDILTGTSAGGINAVFLAKALSNNQNIKQLKELWLNEGDISVLINDKKSVKDIELSAPDKAKSLLNSNRMYLKLLEAFEGMDNGDGTSAGNSSLFVDELDLFVPTTDFQGTVVPLRLFDAVVEEKRFRQVFHFQYDNNDGRKNDFKKANNPMLAVAARATSSFPFAFEPMRVSQAYSIIEEKFPVTPEGNKKDILKNNHTEFFPKTIDVHGNQIVWENRDLVDGGVLDNKPFGHAISVLAQRKADVMVSRKLLYVEPSPEILKGKINNFENPPDVLENAIASLSSIPSYETIREDLERLLERNRLIDRVTTLIKNAEKDVFEYLTSENVGNEGNTEISKSGKDWEKLGLEDIVGEKGRAVLSYYRLRIVSLTDEIARLVTQAIGVDENSEYFAVIRNLVWAWRKSEFSDYKPPEDVTTIKTSLFFLRRFDLNYRLRRLRFVMLKASRLYYLDEDKDFSKELRFRGVKFKEIREKNAATADSEKPAENAFVEENIRVSKSFVKRINAADVETGNKKADDFMFLKPSEILSAVISREPQKGENYYDEIRLAVKHFQERLNGVFQELQTSSKKLIEPESDLVKHIKSIQADQQSLKNLLESNEKQVNFEGKNLKSESENLQEIKEKNPELFNKIKETADKLLESYNLFFEETRQKIDAIFDTPFSNFPVNPSGMPAITPEIYDAVRGYLKNYYDNFDEYDQISFPIYYQTQVGEAVTVDVMRISPNDATLLDPENKKRQKLAGESLFHFGAFLDRTWRWNDIFWGRLDGSERLIAALLPGKQYEKLRIFLSRQAHDAIIEEELVENNQDELRSLFGTALVNASAGMEVRQVIAKLTQLVTDDVVKTRLNAALQNCLRDPDKPDGNAKVYEFVKNQYQYEKRLEPKSLLRVISRATKVVGDIFEGIADEKAQAGGQMRWIARLGQIFWGLVEVAAPGSFFNMLFKQWLYILYLFEVVLIIGSTIFVKPETQQFGIVSLILTLIVHLTAVALHDYMKGDSLWALFRFIVFGFFVLLTILGGLFVYAFFFDDKFWGQVSRIQEKLSGLGAWFRLIPVALLLLLFGITYGYRAYKKNKAMARRNVTQ